MPRIPQPPPIDGILVVDKPLGKTSHDIVESVRRLVGFRQIGHLGTLDPLATGVLVLALGCATRLARFYSGRCKRYSCAVRFGFATDTYDADGEALGPDSAPAIDAEKIARIGGAIGWKNSANAPGVLCKENKRASRSRTCAQEQARKLIPWKWRYLSFDLRTWKARSRGLKWNAGRAPTFVHWPSIWEARRFRRAPG